MSDIVERLQDGVDLAHTPRQYELLCAEAKREIERLRAVINDMTDDFKATINALFQAHEALGALRAELAEVKQTVSAQLAQMMRDVDRAEAAEAECGRLRELLKDIRAEGRLTGGIVMRLNRELKEGS